MPEPPERPREKFVLAVRFGDEEVANEAYVAVQELLRHSGWDMSVYRFLLDGSWLVVVLGQWPLVADIAEIQAATRHGEDCRVPEDVLRLLWERRAQITAQANWAEGHYRPGLRVRYQRP